MSKKPLLVAGLLLVLVVLLGGAMVVFTPESRSSSPLLPRRLLKGDIFATSSHQVFPMSAVPGGGVMKDTSGSSNSKVDDDAEYSIDAKTRAMWEEFETAMAQAKPTIGIDQDAYYAFCNEQLLKFPKLHKMKYTFPAKPISPQATLSEQLTHAQAIQRALANYYHFHSLREFFAASTTQQGNELSVLRIARKLYQALQEKQKRPLVFGFMGTSVMSGMDNCYYNTLAPLLGRKLSHLLTIPVDMRNQGQNGDSPDQTVQLLCSESMFGRKEVDFLHVWFPMMPQSAYALKAWFLRSWFTETNLAVVTTFSPSGAFAGLEPFKQTGHLTSTGMDPDANARYVGIPADKRWGARGDGFCRQKTREGVTAIMKQNWHYGPMGFELLSDGLLMLYSEALIRALNWMIKGERPDFDALLPALPAEQSSRTKKECTDTCGWRECTNTGLAKDELFAFACQAYDKPSSPPPRAVCASGNHPQFASPNLAELVETWQAKSVNSASSNTTSTRWEQYRSKKFSRINMAFEKEEERYMQREECSAFLDDGFSFKVDNVVRETDWLEFTYPRTQPGFAKGATKILACGGLRAPAPSWHTVLGPDWRLVTRVYHSNTFFEHVSNVTHSGVTPACALAASGRALPGIQPGTRLAFKFMFVGETEEDAAPKSFVFQNVIILQE